MLNEQRLRAYLRLAIVVQCLLLAFFIAGSHEVFVKLPQTTTTDFASFYAAGVLADRGDAAAAYDVARHRAVEEQVIAPGIDYKYFLNPPVFLLICAPLAKLPYLVAFVLFELVTGVVWLLMTTRIAGGGRLMLLGCLAVPELYWAAGWGQNSFLTAGLMGVGTYFLQRRPAFAGAAFGALCIKPHFGVLLPLALLCGRHWRAFIAAGICAGALAALSTALFGAGIWHAFLDMALHARATIDSGRIRFVGHIDAGGVSRLFGASAPAGWTIQAAASLVAALMVGWIWWPRGTLPAGAAEARLAALVAGTMVAMPFLLFYDLLMASVAGAWLVAAARRTSWRPGEPAMLALSMVVGLLAFPAAGLHAPIGCIVAPVLLFFAWNRFRAAAAGPRVPADAARTAS